MSYLTLSEAAQGDTKPAAAKVEAAPVESRSGSDWKATARQIGTEILAKKSSLSMDQVAAKTHKELTERKTKGESGVTGRGGKVPCAGTIKRHALTGIKA